MLGPLRLEVDGSIVGPRTGVLRRLLAMLLSQRGNAIAVDTVIRELWTVRPPESPVRALRLHVHRLRKVFGDQARVLRGPNGYAIHVRHGELDADDFVERILHADQERSDGRPHRANELLTAALRLWRGDPYEDIRDCPFLEPERQRLRHWRIQALEEQAELGLEFGNPRTSVPELRALVAEHPESGRLREALATALRRTSLGSLRARVTVPRQLPKDLPSFTGREVELAALTRLADEAVHTETTDTTEGAVCVVDGMAGVGKTALAVHAAHGLANRFVDGQLYVRLHGFTKGVDPVEPAVALNGMLRSIVVPAEQIPFETAERSALWRERTAGLRLLVVLDNAATSDQMRPLLPAGGLTLVTTRIRLADDVHRLTVHPVPLDVARELFVTVATKAAAENSTDRLDEVIELCGRLPLAIRMIAGRLRDRPTWRLDEFVDQLRAVRELTEFALGDRSVGDAFAVSYEHLDAGHRRLFRLLGLHPGTDFDDTAALAGRDVEAVRLDLTSLTQCHLLESPAPGCYRFHDLLRTHAADRARTEEAEADRAAALQRLTRNLTGFDLPD